MINVGWKNILKNTDFLNFLISVFDIPRSEAKNIQASKGLKQALSDGRFLDYIEENDFTVLAVFAEAKEYEKLINYLEELFRKSLRIRQNEHRQRPEIKQRRRENRQRPERKERKRLYDKKYNRTIRRDRDKERYANDPEYRKKIQQRGREQYRRKKEREKK